MGLSDALIKLIGPAAIVGVIKKQDPVALGKEVADVVDTTLDDQFGDKKSEQVQRVLVPFILSFVK